MLSRETVNIVSVIIIVYRYFQSGLSEGSRHHQSCPGQRWMARRLGRVYCDDTNGGGCGGILGMKVSMVILTSLGVERVM